MAAYEDFRVEGLFPEKIALKGAYGRLHSFCSCLISTHTSTIRYTFLCPWLLTRPELHWLMAENVIVAWSSYTLRRSGKSFPPEYEYQAYSGVARQRSNIDMTRFIQQPRVGCPYATFSVYSQKSKHIQFCGILLICNSVVCLRSAIWRDLWACDFVILSPLTSPLPSHEKNSSLNYH